RCARGRDRHTRKFANAPLNMISAAATPANKTEHEGRLTRRSWRQPDTLPPRFKQVAEHGELKGTESVLVVEDAPSLRGVLAALLRKLGYHVFEAADALAAQRLAHSQRKIHLLLMELSVPETTDVELL